MLGYKLSLAYCRIQKLHGSFLLKLSMYDVVLDPEVPGYKQDCCFYSI